MMVINTKAHFFFSGVNGTWVISKAVLSKLQGITIDTDFRNLERAVWLEVRWSAKHQAGAST